MKSRPLAKREFGSTLRFFAIATWMAALVTVTGCASTQSPETPAEASSPEASSLEAPQSSLDPSQFQIVGKKVYDDPWLGTAFTFKAEGSELTVTAYSYAAPPAKNPTDTGIDRVVEEVANVLKDMEELQRSGTYADLNWKTYTSGTMPDGSVIVIQPVTLRIGERKVKSFIVVSLKNERFLKLRLTHPAALESYSGPEVGDFARALFRQIPEKDLSEPLGTSAASNAESI